MLRASHGSQCAHTMRQPCKQAERNTNLLLLLHYPQHCCPVLVDAPGACRLTEKHLRSWSPASPSLSGRCPAARSSASAASATEDRLCTTECMGATTQAPESSRNTCRIEGKCTAQNLVWRGGQRFGVWGGVWGVGAAKLGQRQGNATGAALGRLTGSGS